MVPEYEEIISISPLDELLFMGNYLNTIHGTLVNNSAAGVHTMREAHMKRKKKERELMNLPLPSEPESSGSESSSID